MNVLLINPPYMRLLGIVDIYLPLGLGYLARHLRRHGVTCAVYNADLPDQPGRGDESLCFMDLLERHSIYRDAVRDSNNVIWSGLAETLAATKPDLIGIGVMSAKLESAVRVARISKQVCPSSVTVCGGPHATVAPEDLLCVTEIDFVVRGEGEHTLLELCEAVADKRADLTGIDGLSFRSNGKVVHNRPRALEKDITVFGYPTREEYFHLEKYPKSMISPIMSGRGCPYDCTFCNAKCTWTRHVRYRDLDNVMEEILLLKERYAVPSYAFWDDSFTANRKRTEALLDKIVAKLVNLPWECTTRIDLFDDRLLGRMIEAGCNFISIGLESASDRMLKVIKKNITMADFHKGCAILERHKMNYGVFLMTGFPEETEEDILLTLDYAKNSKAPVLCLSVFTPYPGCESYDRAKEMGMIQGHLDWSSYSHQSPDNYFCPNVPRPRFLELLHQLAEAVDNHNKRASAPHRRYLRRLGYYSRNPRHLAGKLGRMLSR